MAAITGKSIITIAGIIKLRGEMEATMLASANTSSVQKLSGSFIAAKVIAVLIMP